MLWLPAWEEQDVGWSSVPRSREQAPGRRGRGGGSAVPELQHRRISCGSRRAPLRGAGPRTTPHADPSPRLGGPGPSRGPSRGPRPVVPPAWRCCSGPCCWRPALPPRPRPGSWRAPCWRRTGRSCACCGCWEWPGRASTGGPTSASTSRPGSRPAPSPPRIPAAAAAARAGCSAARPRCPCSPSCPTCRCRWWSAAGSRSPVTAPSPAPLVPTQVTHLHPPHPPPHLHPHHHPRGRPRGLAPGPARPCRGRPAAPCPQRSCNKEILGSDVCVSGGDGLGDPGGTLGLGQQRWGNSGLVQPRGHRPDTDNVSPPPQGSRPPHPPRPAKGGPRGVQMPPPIHGDTRGPPRPARPPKRTATLRLGAGRFPRGSPGAGPPWWGDKRDAGVAVGTAMPSSWVLVLAVLGGACALPTPASLSYVEALAQAVDSYNQQPEVQNAFRLLSAEPEPAPGVELSSLRTLNFSMMETECAASARANPDECDFKENGAIKECSGPVRFRQDSPEIDLRCSDASSDPVLVQRGRFGRFLRKVRRFRPRVKFDVRLKGTVGLG